MNSRMKHNTAFTLIELIVVILLAAIISAIAVVRWPGSRINLNAAAQQLASDIRYTQTLAMSRAQDYVLTVSSSSYAITTGSGAAVNNPITGSATVTLSSGITITIPPTNLPNNLIAFDSQGIPQINSNTTTPLANAAVITLTSGSNTTTVTIQPQTGRVTVP